MIRKICFSIVLVLICMSTAYGQESGVAALRNEYPLLMQKFGDEVQQQRAAYFFIIDVSGSMNQYKGIVEPALKEFFGSLQDGDYVDVIRFGEEAEKVDGCYGTISRDKIQSLCRNVDNIYFATKPSDPETKSKLWNNTNLANALRTLSSEMHQIGLTDEKGNKMLKFVFFITDFEHEPAQAGGDDWNAIKQQFEHEQQGYNVNLITLQLPGKPTHLQQVRNALPDFFTFQTKVVADGSELSSWFVSLKNHILLDKFKAIVSKKIKDINPQIKPEIDINGDMEITAIWTPNELFDNFSITSLNIDNTDWEVLDFSPLTITEDCIVLPECRVKYKKSSFVPAFINPNAELVATINYNDSLSNELNKLIGEDAPKAQTVTTFIDKTLYCHVWTLGWCVICLALLIIYVTMIFVAMSRNRRWRICGTFYVSQNGVEITQRKRVKGKPQIHIGNGAKDLPVSGCRWQLIIKEKKVPVLVPLLHFRSPGYQTLSPTGNRFKVAGRQYTGNTPAKLFRGGDVIVETDYKVRWINH